MSNVEKWLDSWQALGVSESPALRQVHSKLLERYSEPHRHYHTRQHLVECFANIREILHLAQHPPEVEIALWFHDAIYDTRATDNEQRSAAWARDLAHTFCAPADVAQRLYDLIMFTRHATEPVGVDAQVLVDADLSILGTHPERFSEYEAQIRTEYGWVPEPLFRQRRDAILRGFLARQHIYFTPLFQTRYEAQARTNMTRSLSQLRV
jgi:predicted metal-dependent HD superfamily phosphohydrolase